MPRRDDLIGLLRSLDRAMKEAEPRVGHEARMRARLSAATRSGERGTRALVLALCAVTAGVATWIGWAESRSIEPSALPLAAPSASGEVIAEPLPEPRSSARPARPSPRRSAPALPLLPPHGELSPPRSPDREIDPREAPRVDSPSQRAPARSFVASAGEGSAEGAGAGLGAKGAQPASRTAAWGPSGGRDVGVGAASGGASRGPLTSMGTITGEPRSSGDSGAKARGTAPSGASEADGKQDVSEDAPEPGGCEVTAFDFAGSCVSSVDLKEIGAATCEAKGRSFAGLDAPFDCGDGATAMKITCCAPGGTAGEPDPYAACKPISAGDGVTCLDVGILEEQAAATCLSWGMDFAQPVASGVCGAGIATSVDALCCPPSGAPAEVLPSGTVGDGAHCQPDEVLHVAAIAECSAEGLSLADFSTADDCDGDASTIAKFACGK